MFHLELPETPHDGFEIDWWMVETDVLQNPILERRRAVYYVNTPWASICPELTGGADLVDCWMLYGPAGDRLGRFGSWQGAADSLARFPNAFRTLEDAIHEARSRLIVRLHYVLDEAREITDCLRELASPPTDSNPSTRAAAREGR